jgi:hypothetical protein
VHRQSNARSRPGIAQGKAFEHGLFLRDHLTAFKPFGRNRLKFLLFQELKANALSAMKKLYGYIEQATSFSRTYGWLGHNTGAARTLPFLRERPSYWQHHSRLRCINHAVDSYELRRRVASTYYRETKTTPMIFPDTGRRLGSYYRKNIIKLQNLIERDLNAGPKNICASQFNPRLDTNPLHEQSVTYQLLLVVANRTLLLCPAQTMSI